MIRLTLSGRPVRKGVSKGEEDFRQSVDTPSRTGLLNGRPLRGQNRLGVFSYYQLSMLFLNMVCLTVALAYGHSMTRVRQHWEEYKAWAYGKGWPWTP